MLDALSAKAIALHATNLIAKLSLSDKGVRDAVLQALGKLVPGDLMAHADTLCSKLEDLIDNERVDLGVQLEAENLLGKVKRAASRGAVAIAALSGK